MSDNETESKLRTTENDRIRIRGRTRYISVGECAELVRLSKTTIYQMLKEGRIDGAFRVNRTWRIPVADNRVKVE